MLFSPSFWFSDEIFDYTQRIPNKKLSQTSFYFRAGEKEGEEMIPLMHKMRSLLLLKGVKPIKINYKTAIDGKHNESFWGSLFPSAAIWLLNENNKEGTEN